MMDYNVPVKYGLLDKKFLEEQRYSSTLSSDSFARESMSIWTGASNEAWFDSKILLRQRKLLYCERQKAKNAATQGAFYIIGVDVARFKANTAIMVIKVIPREGYYQKNVVYTEVIHGENFITQQAPRIKELIRLYEPREVVIDANGLGAGLMDAMVLPSMNPKTGEQYPAYFAFNREQHLPKERKVPVAAPLPEYNAIIYALKAGAGGDDPDEQIHANIFSQMTSGHVNLLANERIVKEKMMSSKKGQKMGIYDKRVYLLPYEMTSRLVDEMCNLRLKPTGIQNKLQIEQISKSTPKDRFSSLEYALWRVKYYEDEAMRRRKRKLNGNFAFFTPKTRK